MNLFLTACTTLGFYLANSNVSYDNMVVQREIAYGNKPYETLDVYTPKSNNNQRTLIYFYGGGWSDGDKKNYSFVADRFVKEGYSVVIPNYGKYPKVTYPTFVEEAAQAVAWTHEHLKPKSLFVMGHSAGAYNAAMMATDPRYLANYHLTSSVITGVIGIAGPYEFTPGEEKYQRIFNNMPDYTQMHVSTFVTGDEPPMLLLHGLKDDTVYPLNTELLSKKITASGGKVEVITYPNVEHIKIIGALTPRWEHYAPVAKDVLEFMDKYALSF